MERDNSAESRTVRRCRCSRDNKAVRRYKGLARQKMCLTYGMMQERGELLR